MRLMSPYRPGALQRTQPLRMLSLGELVVIGVVAAVVVVGPKNVLPRIAETVTMAKDMLNDTKNKDAAAKAGQEAPKAEAPKGDVTKEGPKDAPKA